MNTAAANLPVEMFATIVGIFVGILTLIGMGVRGLMKIGAMQASNEEHIKKTRALVRVAVRSHDRFGKLERKVGIEPPDDFLGPLATGEDDDAN